MTESAGRRYAGLDQGQRQADRRQRLVDAALAHFGTVGYERTKITELCGSAGVAPVHFYEAFSGKEELLQALYDQIVESTMTAVVSAIAAAAPDAAARARAGLDAFCGFLLTDPRRARVQCIEVVGVSAELEVSRQAVIRGYAAFLLEQFDQSALTGPALSEPTRQIVSTALVGGVNEAMIDWLLADDPPPIGTLAATLADLLSVVAVSFPSIGRSTDG